MVDDRDEDLAGDVPDGVGGEPLCDEEYYEEIVVLDLRPPELRDRW
jgi:hypothetical protein